MKFLEELEQRVLGLVEDHKKLKAENSHLLSEIKELKSVNEKLELSLLDKSDIAEEFEKERSSIKHAIEGLLKNIDKLQEEAK